MMDSETLTTLIAKLLVSIRIISGYDEPATQPVVTPLPQQVIATRFCGRPCAVRAYYVSGRGIFIDDSLDVENEAYDRSILLHELVHYVQDVNGAFAELRSCDRLPKREREAYWIQDEYLKKFGGPPIPLAYSNRFGSGCRD
jgi:hypothetical protein